jgi:hypothetical protein
MTAIRKLSQSTLDAIKQAWRLDGSVIVWNRDARGGKREGDPVGFSTRKSGHRNVFLSLDGKFTGFVYARIVWFLHHGDYPDAEIDHIDCDPSNDHPSNLRLASREENNQNTRFGRTRKPFKGTYQDKRTNKWHCQLQAFGKVHGRYGFETQEQAYAARQELANTFHGAFAR